MSVAAIIGAASALTIQLGLSLGATTHREVDGGGALELVYINLTPAMLFGIVTGVGAVLWQWRRSRRVASAG